MVSDPHQKFFFGFSYNPNPRDIQLKAAFSGPFQILTFSHDETFQGSCSRHPDHPVRDGCRQQVPPAPPHPDTRLQDQVPPALQGPEADRGPGPGQQAFHLLPVVWPQRTELGISLNVHIYCCPFLALNKYGTWILCVGFFLIPSHGLLLTRCRGFQMLN